MKALSLLPLLLLSTGCLFLVDVDDDDLDQIDGAAPVLFADESDILCYETDEGVVWEFFTRVDDSDGLYDIEEVQAVISEVRGSEGWGFVLNPEGQGIYGGVKLESETELECGAPYLYEFYAWDRAGNEAWIQL